MTSGSSLPGDREVVADREVGRRDDGDLAVVALQILEAAVGGREHVGVGRSGRGERRARGDVERAVGRAVAARVDRGDREAVGRDGREAARQEAGGRGLPEQHAVAVDGIAAHDPVAVHGRIPRERDARVGDGDGAHVRRRGRREAIGAGTCAGAGDGRGDGAVARGVVGAHAQHEGRRAGEGAGRERRRRPAREHLAEGAEELVARDGGVVGRGAERHADRVLRDGGHPQRGRACRRIGVLLRAHDQPAHVRPARVDLAGRAHLPEPAAREQQHARPDAAHAQRLQRLREAAVAGDPQVVALGLRGLVPAERHHGDVHDRTRLRRGLRRTGRAARGVGRQRRRGECAEHEREQRGAPPVRRRVAASHRLAYRLRHTSLAPPRGGTCENSWEDWWSLAARCAWNGSLSRPCGGRAPRTATGPRARGTRSRGRRRG